MNWFDRIVDNRKRNSFAARMRQRRFKLFSNLLATVPKPIKILDVGGTERFWEVMEFTDFPDVEITLLNRFKMVPNSSKIHAVVGDATNMEMITDNQFDIIFSNFVIEHVGDYDQQRRIAQEIQRVGCRYFVQTPNYSFPIEPHFLCVGFQWLPVSVRVFLIQHFDLGWIKRKPDAYGAKELIESIQLL